MLGHAMTAPDAAPLPVILDCDPGHDDALAIMLTHVSDSLNLLGITTVSGNGGIDRVTENARRVCALAHIDSVRIAQGATQPLSGAAHAAPSIHGESALDGADLPEPQIALETVPAATFMAELITASARPVTIIATGPLTNVALLIRDHPAARHNIAQISLMGGSTDRGNWTPLAEFNIWADPEAADIVFKSGIPILMAGLNVTHKVLVTKNVFDRIEQQNTPLARTIVPLLKFFAHTYDVVFGMPDPPLHDPVAVFALTHPQHMKFVHTHVAIEVNGTLTRGATVVDLHNTSDESPNALVAVDINPDAFWDVMVDAIHKLGESK